MNPEDKKGMENLNEGLQYLLNLAKEKMAAIPEEARNSVPGYDEAKEKLKNAEKELNLQLNRLRDGNFYR